MRNFISFFLLLVSNTYSQTPPWIKEPTKICPNSEICVLGSGKTLEKATSVAREELAKVLKVKIVGNTTFNSFSRQTRENEMVEGKVNENFSKGIEEISDEILEGTFVKETYKDENYFVYLGLDKFKTGQIIKHKILLMDDKIEHLYQLGRRASLFEAIKIFPIREDLDSRYEYFMGERIVPKVTQKMLYYQKERFFKKQTKIFLKFTDFDEEQNLKSFIMSKLLELGLFQVQDPNEYDAFEVRFYLEYKKSYFNVPGFEKYQFNFTAYSYNRSKIKIGMLNFSSEGIGRNYNQAKENALEKIKQFLNDNINQLNID